MNLTDKDRDFVMKHPAAAMVTLRADGTAHAVRVGVGLVDGKLWSSGTTSRIRTAHLRRDPHSTLFVFGQSWEFLTLEAIVTVLDGPEAPELNIRLFRVLQEQRKPAPTPGNFMWFGKEITADEFRQTMVKEQRLIYEFEITRAYGLH